MPYFFSLVKDLKPSTTLWAMQLCLLRSFDVPAYNNKNEVASFEFIFQDKEARGSKDEDETNPTRRNSRALKRIPTEVIRAKLI
ncbi:hypothetical protein OROMI_007132 [Orobanche minor]